ncbi:Os02g0159700 [Oryza sativa Japonica Group]|uniref:Os02g0159700 protein n=1 Tax=Oryza sativa subsp. japonica TaxID=39947 RepID=A0A0P0VEV6_ORYSJ|nr:Os02g0159700 [Oryza sativa Japonica Group]
METGHAGERRHGGGLGEGVDEQVRAVVVAPVQEPLAAGAEPAGGGGQPERPRVLREEAAEAAVGEAEARRQRRRRAVFPRGRAPRAARGAEADAVGVGREAAEDLAGDVQREVPPRRRRRRARRRRPRPFARPLHHLVCAQKRTNEGTQVVSLVSDTYIYSLLTISDSFTAYGIW